MHSQELKKLETRLLEPISIPVIGRCLQKKAVAALAEHDSPGAVKVLAKGVTRLKDEEIKEIVLDALGKLRNQNCINAFCQVWADTRHRDLTNLLVKKGWVASAPVDVRVLSALKAKQLEVVTNGGKEIVEPLLNAFQDKDTEIANRASECATMFDQLEYQELLFRLVLEQDHPIARQVVIKAQYAPREPSQRALFYFLTKQWDKYESLDYEHSLLQKVYELGDEKLRKQIADKARQAARVDWVQIVAGGRKGQRLGEMTDAEWETTLAVLNSGKQWEKMWQLAQKAPAIRSKQLLLKLKQVEWLPQVEEERLSFNRLEQLADKCSTQLPSIGGLTNCQRVVHSYRGDKKYDADKISFSPDGKILASHGLDRNIRLWQMPNGELLTTITHNKKFFRHISFSPDGKILASCNHPIGFGDDIGEILLWQMPDGQPLATLTGNTHLFWGIIFSPDGRILASCSSDGTIRLWQMPDGQPLATLTGHIFNSIIKIGFSPDGRILASCSDEENTIRLWRMPDGQPLATLTGHKKSVTNISFSPDGRIFASCSKDNTIRLWRMPDGQPLATLAGHTKEVTCASFSPDGRILASCSEYDNTIRLWRIPDGQPLATLNYPSSYNNEKSKFWNVIFSPDGQILASYGRENEILLWQMPDGKPLAYLTGHKSPGNFYSDGTENSGVRSVIFSSDGKILASSGNDQTIRLWSSSDLHQVIAQPIERLREQDKTFIQESLKTDISEDERPWLEFMQALMDWHRRFDVEVEDAPQLISTGEFDIEIEG